MSSWINLSHLINKQSRLFHGNPIFETVKAKVIILLFVLNIFCSFCKL